MKTRTLLLFFAFILILPATSEGQVGNLLKNKLNRVVSAGAKTVDKEIDNQIDTAVQKKADDVKVKADERVETNRQNKVTGQPSQDEGTDASAPSGQGGMNLGKMMANKVDLKYKEEYSYTSRIYMLMEMYDKKDVMKMDYYLFYSSSSPSVGIETRTVSSEEADNVPIASKMIMDGENKCFLMLTDVNGMKMGMISAIPDENTEMPQPDGKNAKKDTPPVFTKTGNTRVIVGYKCDEYSYLDPDDKTTGKVWFTKDARLKIDKRGWNNSGMAAYYGNNEFNEGIILANEAYDEKGTLTMKSETKEINENFPHSISVKGYSLRQMNLGQKQKK